MKITFVLPYAGLAGGIRGIAQYAERLSQRGHEVFIISTPQPPPPLKDLVKSLIKGNGWPSIPAPDPSHLDNIDVPHHIINRLRPITDGDVPEADVVIATWWLTAKWVARLSAKKGAKVYFMQDYGLTEQELKMIIPTWSLPFHIITISSWLVDLMRKYCGEISISLVPNAVDTQIFYAPPRKKQTRPTVGLTYRPIFSKGPDIASEAVQIARKNVPDLFLLAYGPDRLNPSFPLPSDTEYIRYPTDEQIRQIYASCDAWLFSSRVEGFGLPILEAMACRTPVIGTPAGAAPELLTDGAGRLLSSYHPEQMAQAIEAVCNLSDDQWQCMSDAAYAQAGRYTLDEAVDLFEAALYTAVERWQSGSL